MEQTNMNSVENVEFVNQVKSKAKQGILPKAPGISWIALFLLWIVFVMNATDREIMNRIMPLIVNEYKISADAIGGIVTLIIVSGSFFATWIGRWSDRKGRGWSRKKSNIWIALAYTLLTFLTGFTALTAVIGGFLILQVLRSAFSVAGESIEVSSVAEWWPEESRGFALGAHHTGYPWGTLLSGLAISSILALSGDNWRTIYLMVPLAIIPIFLIYWIFATPKNFKKYESRTREMGLTPTIDSNDTESVEKKGAVVETLKNPNILVGTIALALGFAGYVGISFWLAPYLAFVAKFNYAAAAAWSVVFTITGGIGQIVWGTISDKIGRRMSLLINFAWLSIGFYLLQYVGNGLGWLIAIQLFLGCSTNAIYPVGYALVIDSAKKGYAGTATGILISGISLGGLSPLVLGIFINAGGGWEAQQGYVTGLYFLVALMVICFFLILLFTRETVGKKRAKDWSLVSQKSCGIVE
ncbi:MFS transporter [Paenibacillus elgii]|uniref:MFS transporter n=1 Tax=Paenibacillus elgii TaxID=189691 RepID=UPI002D7C9B1E|nr:MFS transporter [Paenibacillus elgii]